jgi:hypothetical protein
MRLAVRRNESLHAPSLCFHAQAIGVGFHHIIRLLLWLDWDSAQLSQMLDVECAALENVGVDDVMVFSACRRQIDKVARREEAKDVRRHI